MPELLQSPIFLSVPVRPGTKIESHPLRALVEREVHSRPYVEFREPAYVYHFTFLVSEDDHAKAQAGLDRFRDKFQLRPTYETARHAIYAGTAPGLGRIVVTWERHTEIVAFAVFINELVDPFRPLGLDIFSLLPAGFLDHYGAPPLVATYIAIGTRDNVIPGAQGLNELFEGQTLNGSQVMAGRAEAWSCYRVHKDGFNRIALLVNEMSPMDLGRTVQRLLIIEDAYHLALLAVPLARDVRPHLATLEWRLTAAMETLRVADSPEQKREVLDTFLTLAAEVQTLGAKVAGRFAVSSANYAALDEQFKELREEKIEHVLRLSRFLMRRVSTATRTFRSIQDRLTNLSEHIGGAAELLRTSVDLHVEEQNQRLLESFDRRSRLQLQLQHALEGLSVVVFSYYTLGLLSHILAAAEGLGLHIRHEVVLGFMTPVLLLIYWNLIRLIRRKFHERS